MLKISHLNVHYGPIPALLDVSLAVMQGKVVTVLGANGAGKSTLLRAISGVARTAEGSIEWEGRPLLRRGLGLGRLAARHLRADQIVRAGIVHVPEGRQLFPRLTVEENLRLGGHFLSAADVAPAVDRVFGYFPVLKHKRARPAGGLSGGEQQMLAIGRGLIARPKLLLLDEPSVGLSPRLVEEVFEIIHRINQEEGCGILLVEQNAAAALAIAEYGYVLEAPGHICYEGPSDRLSADHEVRRAYLGG